ncbi:LolA family protein [Granulicella arctica]|uniref:Outer membrane lipoprotein-sorting protein n=1 Tax=Granulicella arctica TaxID=940613 RepID=A0A7Y9PHZ2_9BACT|nr:outer membrane lipoprotein-sorting protein [Granulicella arctica]NYF80099.1 outer membrane lipoprotein-sorting protein [Granulicella arctica]
MTKLCRMAMVLALSVMGMATSAVAQSSHLDGVLKQMDAASVKFHSAEANFRWDFFERVTKSMSSQAGTIYFERQKNGSTEMGAKMVTPGVKFLGVKDNVLQVFDPMANTLIRITPHGDQTQYESFLTLGFGGSGSDLAKSWVIADQGTEIVDGVSCAKLDLVSKDQNVKNMFTHVTIWVDLTRGISLKQMFYTPSEDIRTAVYSGIKYNTRVDMKPYGFKANAKTSVTNR